MAAHMSEFNEHADSIAEKYLNAIMPRYSISYIEYSDHIASIHCEEYYHGSRDTDILEMPIDLLWSPNWEQRIEELREEHVAKQLAEAERKTAKSREQRRTSELAELARLQSKYSEE